MPTPTRAVEAYVGMWNATDDRERRALAEEALTEDAVLLYPTFEAHSRKDAVAQAGRFQDDTPGARIEMLSGVEHHHGWVCRGVVHGAFRRVVSGQRSIHWRAV